MIKVIDPGHVYQLLILDWAADWNQDKGAKSFEQLHLLQFVKREGEKFPGNVGHHPGTTMQSVIRCLIDRIDYLHNQIPDPNNPIIREYFLRQLWLLEERAARRHQYAFDYFPADMDKLPMCPHCGHVVCPELGNAVHDAH